jgi:hypothetical protein
MRIVKIVIGLILLAFFVIGGVLLQDYIHLRNLESNLQAVKPGMSESELIKLLGKPDTLYIGDIGPREYLCFGKRVYDDNPDSCPIAIEMSAPPRTVIKVLK